MLRNLRSLAVRRCRPATQCTHVAPTTAGLAMRSSLAAPSEHFPCFSMNALLACQRRMSSTTTNEGGAAVPGSSQSPSDAAEAPSGVVVLTAANVNAQLKSKVPTMLYFHVNGHPEVDAFTKDLKEQVALANRDHRMTAAGYEATGEDRGLSMRLATIDCMTEQALAQQFNIDPHQFPLILFLYKQQVVDRLVGVLPAAQIKDAIAAFVQYAQQDLQNAKDGKGPGGIDKVPRVDNDDENVLTLIQAAQRKLKDKDFAGGEKLYQKAVALGREKVAEAKTRLGLDKKRMTPELFDRLKKEPHYFGLAQALAGVAMCHGAQKRFDEAAVVAAELRADFPAAIKELRDVAEAVVRIDLIRLTGFDLEKDNYISLMKREELLNDPAVFYSTQVKLAAAHVFEKRHAAGIDECLRLIRSEPKLLPELKAAGAVPADATLTQKDGTPARKVLFLIFEALGNADPAVIAARKKLAAYL